MQRFIPGIGDAFGPVEKALRETFVPALLEELGEGALDRGVTRLPVKQAVLALLDPTLTAPEKWTASCVITRHPIAALIGKVEVWAADNSACIWYGWTSVRQRSTQQA